MDRSLSRFRDDSELTWLNRLAGTGTVVPVSRRLRIGLALTDRAGRVTDDRFDASILDTLERIGERGAHLAAAPDAPRAVTASEQTSRAHVPQVPLDMGGVGKGLALRWAADDGAARASRGRGAAARGWW